jgi:hypothetical protein
VAGLAASAVLLEAFPDRAPGTSRAEQGALGRLDVAGPLQPPLVGSRGNLGVGKEPHGLSSGRDPQRLDAKIPRSGEVIGELGQMSQGLQELQRLMGLLVGELGFGGHHRQVRGLGEGLVRAEVVDQGVEDDHRVHAHVLVVDGLAQQAAGGAAAACSREKNEVCIAEILLSRSGRCPDTG